MSEPNVFPYTADGPVGGPVVYRRAHAVIPVSAEMLAEAEETRAAVGRWMAMSPEERAAVAAKRDAERAAARAAADAEARRFLAWLRSAVAGGPFAEAHLAIIEEHPTQDGRHVDTFADALVCATCAAGEELEGDPYPCVTLRALARAYGWSP